MNFLINHQNKLSMVEIFKSDAIELFKKLIEAFLLPIDTTGDNGMTFLHFACRFSAVAIVSYLIDKGANVNAKDDEGETPLHTSCRLCGRNIDSSIIVIKKLIDNGADVNAIDNFGKTPLHFQCTFGVKPIVFFLVSMGADCNARDDVFKQSAFFTLLDTMGDDLDLIKFLIEKGKANLLLKTKEGGSVMTLLCFKKSNNYHGSKKERNVKKYIAIHFDKQLKQQKFEHFQLSNSFRFSRLLNNDQILNTIYKRVILTFIFNILIKQPI